MASKSMEKRLAVQKGEQRGGDTKTCYAYRENGGDLDLDSISDTPENVRLKYLQSSMGWRFEHPDRYDQNEAWKRVLEHGNIVSVAVSVVENHAAKPEMTMSSLIE